MTYFTTITPPTERLLWDDLRKIVTERSEMAKVPNGIEKLPKISMLLRHFVLWPSVDIQVKFYGDRPGRAPPSGELNT